MIGLSAFNTHVHVENQSIEISPVLSSEVGHLSWLLISILRDRSLEVLWLWGLKHYHTVSIFLSACAELKFIKAERMRVRTFNFVSPILVILAGENLHESVFCVHRVAVLSMLCVLLYVDDNGWGLSEHFKKGIFQVWDPLSVNHYFSCAFPMAFKHFGMSLELWLLHLFLIRLTHSKFTF